MIRGNASGAVVFHSNLVIDSRCEDEAAAEVEVGGDAHHEIGPVTAVYNRRMVWGQLRRSTPIPYGSLGSAWEFQKRYSQEAGHS